MKKLLLPVLVAVAFSSCAQKYKEVSADDLSKVLDTAKHLQLVDVRTPGEYSKGHIGGAVNYDWNGTAFADSVTHLDKTQPVYVYCMSGGRSSKAAKKLNELGFTQVYEMHGGMLQWRAGNKPEAMDTPQPAAGTAAPVADEPKFANLTMDEFKKIASSSPLVLIDVYADWCGPCKKLSPILDEINAEMKGKLKLVRIDADANRELMSQLYIEGLPTMFVYKNGTRTWTAEGLTPKDIIVSKLK